MKHKQWYSSASDSPCSHRVQYIHLGYDIHFSYVKTNGKMSGTYTGSTVFTSIVWFVMHETELYDKYI